MELVQMIRGSKITVESELDNFTNSMNAKHLAGHGSEDGAFLYHIDEKIRWVKGREREEQLLLDVVCQRVAERNMVCSVQSLKQLCGHTVYHVGAHDLKIFAKTPAPEALSFLKEANDINSYYSETCCSEIACSNAESDDAEISEAVRATRLLNHFYLNEVVNRAVQIKKEGSRQDISDSAWLEEGKALKQKFEGLDGTAETIFSLTNDMMEPDHCTDIECSPLTDSEEERDDDSSDMKKVQERSSWRRRQYSLYAATSSNSFPNGTFKDLRSAIKITENFNMALIWNILYILPNFLAGLHSSFMYIGTRMSMFAAHFEDACLWSMNYLFMGAPKIWIIIPPYATKALDFWLSQSGGYLFHTSCRNLLGHKNAFPTTSWLTEHKIPFKVIIQRPGDLVVLLPDAVHFGFNCGWNIAQAINFATESWLPIAAQQSRCLCFGTSQIHLPLEPLLAAFRPDLLRMYRSRHLIKVPYLNRSSGLLYSTITGNNLNGACLKRSAENGTSKNSLKIKKQIGQVEKSVSVAGCSSSSITHHAPPEDDNTNSKKKKRFGCPVSGCSYSVLLISKGRVKKQITNHLLKRHKAHINLQGYLHELK